jgi:polysaccharide biosynthesis protein PslG
MVTLQQLGAACACAAAAIGGSAVLLPQRADAATGSIAGVTVHPWRFESSERPPHWALRDPAIRDRSFAALQDAGVRDARVDLRWNIVEQQVKGLRDWTEFDAIHRSAVVHGIKLLPTVAFTPPWAGRSGDPWAPPNDPADFGDFVAAALERYPDIEAWEIWNEPNLAFFWRPSPDVGAFVGLLRAADEARRRVGSHAKLISGGLSSTGEDPFRWFDEMARLGAFAHVDGFGLHPYSKTFPPDQPKAFFLKIPEFRKRLVRLGRPDVGLWLTEYSTPNTATQTEYGPPISAEQQAENLGLAYTLASLWPWVENLSWYELQEGCADENDADCRFGLFTIDFVPKPALARLRSTLAGEVTRLRSDLTLRVERGAPTRMVNVRGTLTKAGEAGSAGLVTVTAAAGTRVRTVRARARGGSYVAKLGRLGPGKWRIASSSPGTRWHLPARSPTASVKVP